MCNVYCGVHPEKLVDLRNFYVEFDQNWQIHEKLPGGCSEKLTHVLVFQRDDRSEKRKEASI